MNYDENFERDAMDDADASLQADADELRYDSVEEMLIAQEEVYKARQDYQQSQVTR